MKRAILAISYCVFLDWMKEGFKGSHAVIENGLPPDVKLIDIKFNCFSHCVEVLLESDSFNFVDSPPYPSLPPVVFEVVRGDDE